MVVKLRSRLLGNVSIGTTIFVSHPFNSQCNKLPSPKIEGSVG